MDNKEKISKLVDVINQSSGYAKENGEEEIENGITYDGKLLYLIRQLIETLCDEFGIVKNEGVVLNVSLKLKDDINSCNLKLSFDKDKCYIFGHSEKISKELKLLGKKDLLYLVDVKEKPLNITNNKITGTTSDSDYFYHFEIDFDERGLKKSQNVFCNITRPRIASHDLHLEFSELINYNEQSCEVIQNLTDTHSGKILEKEVSESGFGKDIFRTAITAPNFFREDHFAYRHIDSIKFSFPELYDIVYSETKKNVM